MLQGRRSGRTVSAIHGNFVIRRNGCWCLPMRARSGDDRRIHCVGLAVATVTAGGVMHSPAGTQSRSSSRSSSKVINNAAPPEFGSIAHRTDPLAAKPFTASIRSDYALSSLLIRCDNTRPRPGSVARELLGWPLAPLLPDPRGRRLPRRPSQARPGPTPTRAAPTRPPRWSGSSSHRTTCPKRRCGRRRHRARRETPARIRPGRAFSPMFCRTPHALHSAHDRPAGTATTSADKGAPRRRRRRERGNVAGLGVCRVPRTRVDLRRLAPAVEATANCLSRILQQPLHRPSAARGRDRSARHRSGHDYLQRRLGSDRRLSKRGSVPLSGTDY